MARLPPSHHTEHRRIRLPDLREGDHSPLGTTSRRARPAACPTPRLAPAGLSRSGLSVTCPPRSPPCGDGSLSASQSGCPDAPVATRRTNQLAAAVRDAIRLEPFPLDVDRELRSW